MTESSPDDVISWEDLIYLADFFENSGEKRFQILGGEPTLHPEFNQMVIYLLERGFSINVFSNGIMSQTKLEEARMLFLDIPPERLSFTINLNEPKNNAISLAESEIVKRFLQTFGHRTTAGFNIYQRDFSLDFLFQYINEYGLNKTIRMGLTHPISNKKNHFISIPDIEIILQRLFSYIPMFERMRVRPGLDCGFPLCKINDVHLGWLYRHTGGHYDFGCAPVIDIGPDLSVWACFPLSSFHKRSIYEFNHLGEIHEYYSKLHNTIRTEVGGIYGDCDHCRYREENLCKGGCLSHNLFQFGNEEPVRLSEIYE
jgi:radical SAM protein with 4Fe4S-binding SPASM domain